MEDKYTRLNKFLSEAGFCSRREADKLIETKQILVNGRLPEVGTKVCREDDIRVNGEAVNFKPDKFVYLAFNKPVGIECTTNSSSKNNIIDYINYPERIFPIGRLDKDSEGLIFLTNDGDIVNKILRHGNAHEKEYIVTVNKPITPEFISKMSNGIPVLGTITKKCRIEKKSKFVFVIYLTQGLNRQIRRMCRYLGYDVRGLKRMRIMNVSLDIPLGSYRHLRDHEISELKALVSSSKKTQDTPVKKVPKAKPLTEKRFEKGDETYAEKRAAAKEREKLKERRFGRVSGGRHAAARAEKNERTPKPRRGRR